MRKKLISALTAALALLWAISIPAFAVNTDYTGELDPMTNEPIGSSDVSTTGRVALSNTMYYDWDAHDFVYPITGTLGEVHSGAADSMVLTRAVSLSYSQDAPVTVYRDGEIYNGDLEQINSVGEYTVSVTVDGQVRRLLGFRLVGEATNALHTFSPPDGFYVLGATRDGVELPSGRYAVDMEEEGEYSIQYRCIATDMVYTLNVTIDRTPPSLFFSGRTDSEGRIVSELSFTGIEAGEGISLFRNGEAVSVAMTDDGTGGTIYDPGRYTLYAFDAAGNVNEYDFIILQYFNTNSIIFFFAVAVVIAAVAVYIIIKRKRLKIG